MKVLATPHEEFISIFGRTSTAIFILYTAWLKNNADAIAIRTPATVFTQLLRSGCRPDGSLQPRPRALYGSFLPLEQDCGVHQNPVQSVLFLLAAEASAVYQTMEWYQTVTVRPWL